jgi:hypothetical protein
LFSDQYDLFVGKAAYLQNVQLSAWQASQGSFGALDSVLGFERKLNASYDADKKYAYEQRGQKQVKIYSKDYATRYHQMLGGQVERRMRSSILAVASIWYTAWVDAGQPDLNLLLEGAIPAKINEGNLKEQVETERKMIGRDE